MESHGERAPMRTTDTTDTGELAALASSVTPGREAHGEIDAVVSARVRELESQVGALTDERSLLQGALARSERRREIEGLVRDAGAIDVGAAVVLMEAEIGETSGDVDLGEMVGAMVRSKPYLFARHSGPHLNGHRGSVMAGVVDSDSELHEAATTARETGDRHALLRYLRMRNGL